MMPRLDGVGLLQAIRGEASLAPIPVVVVSARAGAEAASGGLEAGADDYVVKPFTRLELLARCRTSLELARLRTEAAGARERSSLVAGVSRDIQSPLAVVRGVLDIITEQDLDQAMRDELGIRALTNVRNLDLLVRQFLDWSHLAVGIPITAYRETTDLSAMLEEVAEAYLGVEYTPPSEPVFASCDPGRTLLVLDNLIGNAVRAARSRVTVLLRPMSEGVGEPVDSYEVEVRDDGPGVPEHVLPHLFSPFSPSSRANGRGTGIGLNVSREAARAQDGDLVLVSSDQRGSCFSLRVRAASPLSGDPRPPGHPGVQPRSSAGR